MSIKSKYKIITLPTFEWNSGSLSVIDSKNKFPFKIERVYFLHDIPSLTNRGAHAHKKLEQLIVAVTGSFKIILDDANTKKEIILNDPRKGLHIKPGLWRNISDFSAGSICLVFASLSYDEDDYIRDYNDFLNTYK